MVIICEESSVYESKGSLERRDKKRGRDREMGKKDDEQDGERGRGKRGPDLPLRFCQRTFRSKNKANKSRASDVYVMGNEIEC